MPLSNVARYGTYILACSLAAATELPVRVYSIADGLHSNSVNRIGRDSNGFLWFSTSDGAARFDGYQFLNFSLGEGLSNRRVNDVLECRSGAIWVATAGGLCRLGKTPAPASAVEREYLPPGTHWVSRLLELRSSPATGTVIWCGTDSGLFRFTARDGKFQKVALGTAPLQKDPFIFDLYEDRSGNLWAGTDEGLYRFAEGAVAARYTVQEGLPAKQVTAVRQDSSGTIWAATWQGAARLSRGRVDLVLNRASGLAGDYLYTMLPLDNGDLWFGGVGGVTVTDPAGVVRRRLSGKDGLVVDDVEALAQDPDGNIWVGTDGAGAVKIAQTGFTTYSAGDGIFGRPSAIFESRLGELALLTKTDDALRLYVQHDSRFRLLQTFSLTDSFGWRAGQVALERTQGEWWIATGAGLYSFRQSGTAQMVRMGLAGHPAPLKIFEDSRGDTWMAFRKSGRDGLARWCRSSGRVEQIAPDDGSRAASSFPFVFAEDKSGAVWIGYFQGQLMRYRDGHLREIELPARAARGIRSLLVDSQGRLWVGTSEAGLLRIDNPGAEQPLPAGDSGRPSLSGELVECLAEDSFGRIYACTNRGLDVLNPASNHLRHYTTEDGLVKGDIQAALRDRAGVLWFASSLGVSRLMPRADTQLAGPYIHISRLDVGGIPQAISRLGQNHVAGLTLPFGAVPVRIEVTGVTFRPGDRLRYQTRLEGADRDWSPPSLDRTTSYVALQPGSYRFLARAVNAEGATSPLAAELDFAVLPPFWRRWWFVSLAAAALTAGVLSAHRVRVARLMAIERVRDRIAGDLHDDIGASLSQIAVMSEVARRESGAAAQGPLERISELSGEVLESMSDIVWAINPARDRSADLIQRMRHVAADRFTAADIEMRFTVESQFDGRPTDPELRRELLLIFKEAANNIVKHAAAKQVSIRVWAKRGAFGFEVFDDGQGFDRSSLSGEGNGLPGIERRVKALAGTCRIVSSPGNGTLVWVEVPVRARGWTYTKR